VVHRRGLLWNYIGASAAIPGVFPALFENGDLLMDGGLIDEVPVSVARAEGLGSVVGINVSQEVDLTMQRDFNGRPRLRHVLASIFRRRQHPKRVPSLLRILHRTVVLSNVYRKELSRREADLFLDIPLEDFGAFDWKRLREIADRGEQSARQSLAAWPEREAHCAGAADPR
jgi:NTE family protein